MGIPRGARQRQHPRRGRHGPALRAVGDQVAPWLGGFLMIALLLIGKNWWALRSAQPKPERTAAILASQAGRVQPAKAREREEALV